MSEFSVRLAECRRKSKSTFSQSELARKAGVSPSLVNRLETGDREPSSRELVLTLSNAMELDKDETDALLASAGYAPEYPIVYRHSVQRLLDDLLDEADEYDIEIVETLILKLKGRRSDSDSEKPSPTQPAQGDGNVARRS